MEAQVRTVAVVQHAKKALKAAILFVVAFGVQLLGLPQPITGPVINATLFTTTLVAGPAYAALIGFLTPTIAWIRGILAAPLAPMIPWIALGNMFMVIVFYLLTRYRQYALGVAVSAVAKFALLATAVQFIVSVPAPIATAMQWPQLFTALIGGCLVLAGRTAIQYRRQEK